MTYKAIYPNLRLTVEVKEGIKTSIEFTGGYSGFKGDKGGIFFTNSERLAEAIEKHPNYNILFFKEKEENEKEITETNTEDVQEMQILEYSNKQDLFNKLSEKELVSDKTLTLEALINIAKSNNYNAIKK
jgi:hypothetical protein